MLAVEATTCSILVYGAQARKPNTNSRWVHQPNQCALVIVSTDIMDREAAATRLPNGDQAPQGSSVAAIRQPSTRNPLTRIVSTTSRITVDSVL